MSVLDHERRAWRPNWQRLVIAAQAAAADPRERPSQLQAIATVASGWILPSGDKGHDLTPVALMHTARAFCGRQTAEGRGLLAPALDAIAVACSDMLDGLGTAPTAGLRPRADLDG